MKMILFVLNDPARLLDLLIAWQKQGASGATVMYSTGMGRLTKYASLKDDLPFMPSLSDFYDHGEKFSRTLFTVIPEDRLEGILQVTREVVGDLNEPGKGILIVLPVDSVHGLIEAGSRLQAGN